MSGRALPAALPSGGRTKAHIFTALLAGVTVLFLLAVVWLFLTSVYQTTWAGVLSLLGDGWFWRSVKLSLVTSTMTTVVAVVVGVPAAYALSRFKVPGQVALDVLFASVIVLPASTVGLCLMVAFQYEPVLRLQEALGFRVVHSLPSIVVAQLVLSLALGIKAWRAAFDSVNPRFEHVARSLGSSRLRAFRTVTLPAAKAGLVAGVILAWTRAMAEFGAVLLFSSTFRNRHPQQFSGLTKFLGLDRADILPVAMWMEIEGGNTERGVAIAFVLVLITAVSVYALHRTSGKGYVW